MYRELSNVRVHHDRLGVVVGECGIGAGLDDPLGNLRRRLHHQDTHTLGISPPDAVDGTRSMFSPRTSLACRG